MQNSVKKSEKLGISDLFLQFYQPLNLLISQIIAPAPRPYKLKSCQQSFLSFVGLFVNVIELV